MRDRPEGGNEGCGGGLDHCLSERRLTASARDGALTVLLGGIDSGNLDIAALLFQHVGKPVVLGAYCLASSAPGGVKLKHCLGAVELVSCR